VLVKVFNNILEADIVNNISRCNFSTKIKSPTYITRGTICIVSLEKRRSKLNSIRKKYFYCHLFKKWSFLCIGRLNINSLKPTFGDNALNFPNTF
jgi:hypothetical protein